MQNKLKKTYIIFFIEILAVVILGTFFFVDADSFDDKIYISSDEQCDLKRGACSIEVGKNQSISFEIFPKDIPLMKPLDLTVVAKGVKENEINVKIYATNMDMGVHKTVLKRFNNDTFRGKQILPTCIVGGMIWNADISSKSFEKGARFSFKTK